MKYGVIDVGGGLRGIYGAGVLDRCLEEDLRFDLCIGVSAGSANMTSYLAGQHGRNKPFYDEYSFRREYMSVHNLIRKHSYLDLGYVYGTLSNAGGENPLDYAALARSPAELCVVAANAQNGEAQYFTKADLHPDDYRILMASCCIPVIDQPCVIDGVPYFDGGLADPVPLEWAFAHGCDRVALILTKPIGLVSSDARDKHLAHLLQSHYPAAAEGLRRRAWRYNTAVQRARAEALRVLFENFNHAIDALAESVVLVFFRYLLLYLGLGDELADFGRVLIDGCWRWCGSDEFVFPSSLVKESLEVLSVLLVGLGDYIERNVLYSCLAVFLAH